MKKPLVETTPTRTGTPRMERRLKRSTELGQAMRFQLDACRAEAHVDAMLVSDDWGLCLAESGAAGGGEELAACLPPAALAGPSSVSSLMAGAGTEGMALRRLVVGSSKLFVCAVGGQPDKRAISLARAEAGLRRILAAS